MVNFMGAILTFKLCWRTIARPARLHKPTNSLNHPYYFAITASQRFLLASHKQSKSQLTSNRGLSLPTALAKVQGWFAAA
jgi:hypothetical protein